MSNLKRGKWVAIEADPASPGKFWIVTAGICGGSPVGPRLQKSPELWPDGPARGLDHAAALLAFQAWEDYRERQETKPGKRAKK